MARPCGARKALNYVVNREFETPITKIQAPEKFQANLAHWDYEPLRLAEARPGAQVCDPQQHRLMEWRIPRPAVEPRDQPPTGRRRGNETLINSFDTQRVSRVTSSPTGCLERENLQNLEANRGHEPVMGAAASWTAATERSAVAAFKAVGRRCRSGPLASGGSQSGDSLRSSPQSKTWRQCARFMERR